MLLEQMISFSVNFYQAKVLERVLPLPWVLMCWKFPHFCLRMTNLTHPTGVTQCLVSNRERTNRNPWETEGVSVVTVMDSFGLQSAWPASLNNLWKIWLDLDKHQTLQVKTTLLFRDSPLRLYTKHCNILKSH